MLLLSGGIGVFCPLLPLWAGQGKVCKGWVLLLTVTPHPVDRVAEVGAQVWVGHRCLCSGLVE